MMRAKFLALLLGTILASVGFAQGKEPATTWTATLDSSDVRVGEGAQVILNVKTRKDWHIYSPEKKGEWVSVTAKVEDTPGVTAGEVIAPPGVLKFDRGFKADTIVHEGEAAYALPIQFAADAPKSGKIKVTVRSQACDARSCDPPKNDEFLVEYKLADGAARPDRLAASTSVPEQPAGYIIPPADQKASSAADPGTDKIKEEIQRKQSEGLGPYMLLAFLAGLAALATPCVWPMIPITVSFFSKRKEGGNGLKEALAYCFGIMGTFAGIGLIVSLVFGAAGLQNLAANVWVNLFLGGLFVFLALNLFGLYEIALPAALTNRVQSQTGKGGLVGPIMMGVLFSITSFTCTVPFAGTVLASASSGNWFFPMMGMLAFSFAFALPFFFLAMFPQYLAKLPKSGGWLVTVKAYMGFLELAAALKFFSNAELTWSLGLMTRPVYLAIWVSIFILAALYLAGWIKLGHDEGESKIGWGRRIVAALNVGVVVYLLAAMQGASLGNIAAFMPPDPYPGRAAVAGALPWKHSLEDGLADSRSTNRLIFVNFTGVTCSNCRVMEGEVFPLKDVRSQLEQFTMIELYTDRELDSDRANAALRDKLTGVATNPVYVVMTADQKVISVYQGLAETNEKFIQFLVDARQKGSSLVAQR